MILGNQLKRIDKQRAKHTATFFERVFAEYTNTAKNFRIVIFKSTSAELDRIDIKIDKVDSLNGDE